MNGHEHAHRYEMKTITILQMNDTHGYLEPHPELFWGSAGAEYRTAGGYARISALIKNIREERNGEVIALDNGDTLHVTRINSGRKARRWQASLRVASNA